MKTQNQVRITNENVRCDIIYLAKKSLNKTTVMVQLRL